MSAQTRYFVVDDRSSSIQYSGTWSTIDGSQYNGAGSFGSTYLNTLQRATTTGSSLSFTFTGDSARIMGTHNVRSPRTAPDPSWRCFLDGEEFTKENPATSTQNNQAFCKFYNLSPGTHTIRLEVVTSSQPLLFDQIQYRPTVRTDNAVAHISRFDPDIRYDSSWQGLGDVARMATRDGGAMDFWFIGNRLTWIGMYPNQLSHTDAPASYSIDNGAPVQFTIAGGGDDSDYNRQIFQTPRLSQGRHHIRVTYQGNGRLTPLVLSHLLVEGGTTEILGTAQDTGGNDEGDSDSGGGSDGGSGTTTITTGGTTITTTTSRPSITVTRVSDADSDLPNADDISDLVTGTLDVHTGTPTHTDGVTVYTIDPNSQSAGNPHDHGSDVNAEPGANESSSSFPVAGIVGIVLGLLLVLALVGLFLLWRRNRRRRHLHLPEGSNEIQPFTPSTISNARQNPSPPYSSSPAMAMASYPSDGTSASTSFVSQGNSPNRYVSNENASDFSGSSTHLLQPVRKMRDPFASPAPSPSAHSSDSDNVSAAGPAGSRPFVHEDSGPRMRPGSHIEEVPPQYTPG